jgi:hypothetical protein
MKIRTYFLPSFSSILTFQSSILSRTRAFSGAMYTAWKGEDGQRASQENADIVFKYKNM